MSKNFDTFMAIFLIILGIFILGVQIGIAHGRELGKELFLSTFTVKNYVSRIIDKLEAKDRTQATAKAIQYAFLTIYGSTLSFKAFIPSLANTHLS